MSVIILRGVPGVGKSSYIIEGELSGVICSADHYHMVGRIYQYDKMKAGWAHNQCLEKYLKVLNAKQDVIVDNTNTTIMEVAPYYRIAECLGTKINVITLICDPLIAARRNIHSVPLRTILTMHNNLMTQPLPAWWNEEMIQCQ